MHRKKIKQDNNHCAGVSHWRSTGLLDMIGGHQWASMGINGHQWILYFREEIEFDAASNPYIATSTTAECLALIFMIVVGSLSSWRDAPVEDLIQFQDLLIYCISLIDLISLISTISIISFDFLIVLTWKVCIVTHPTCPSSWNG